MQIKATYENGRLEFTGGVRLKQGRVRLIVDVPDDAILQDAVLPQARPEPSTQVPAEGMSHSVTEEIDAILRPWRNQLATGEALTKDARRALFSKEWEERHRAND